MVVCCQSECMKWGCQSVVQFCRWRWFTFPKFEGIMCWLPTNYHFKEVVYCCFCCHKCVWGGFISGMAVCSTRRLDNSQLKIFLKWHNSIHISLVWSNSLIWAYFWNKWYNISDSQVCTLSWLHGQTLIREFELEGKGVTVYGTTCLWKTCFLKW